jgi:hypothetical protein
MWRERACQVDHVFVREIKMIERYLGGKIIKTW